MPRKEGVVLQKELITEMHNMCDGAYAKYELEDFMKIFRKTMNKLLLEGKEVDIDNLVSFRQRVWENNSSNWTPVKNTTKVPLRKSCSVKAVISTQLKTAIREKNREKQMQEDHEDLAHLGLVTAEREDIESVAELQQLS